VLSVFLSVAQRLAASGGAMVRYKLYRSAVVCAGGPVGEALTRQLLLSPLCSEVLACGKIDRREFESLNVRKKLRYLAEATSGEVDSGGAAARTGAVAGEQAAQPDGLAGVEAAFCVLGGGRWAEPPDMTRAKQFAELCKVASVPHVTLLSTCWADTASKIESAKRHGEVAELFVSCGFDRLSIFRPSLVLLGRAAAGGLGGQGAPQGAALLERAYSVAFPIVRQFMPSAFREVGIDDLVLAMRLNAELCDTAEKVERLDFVDIMKIIGKEDTV